MLLLTLLTVDISEIPYEVMVISQAVDTNEDGFISKQELRDSMSGQEQTISDDEINTIFQNMDLNKDGEVGIGGMLDHLINTFCLRQYIMS